MKHSTVKKIKILKSPSLTQKYLGNFLRKGKSIGFVPTMGALHPGHISLLRRSRRENDITVVSIFVNPIQFGPKEDFRRYPRPFNKDVEICRQEGVDVIFAPDVKGMYPEGFDTSITVGGKTGLSDILCGASRLGHFNGVATVVAKLFNIVRPTRAYFGEKDYQQLKIIERMVRDLNFPIKIVPCPTIREPSGLAMSSRNVYLSEKEREEASAIYQIISLAKKNPASFFSNKKTKIISPHLLEYKIKKALQEKLPGCFIEYVSIRRSSDLTLPVKEITPMTPSSSWRILVALKMKNGTRLIDNV